MKTEVKIVVCEDIGQIKADAMIVNINTIGTMSFCPADNAIYRARQDTHFNQLKKNFPLKNNKVVVTKGNSDNTGKFENVVFVVDSHESPLSIILHHALKEAEIKGFKSVVIPTIRMHSSLGLVEKTLSDVASEMAKAIEEFLEESCVLESITFVVKKDRDSKTTKAILESYLIKK